MLPFWWVVVQNGMSIGLFVMAAIAYRKHPLPALWCLLFGLFFGIMGEIDRLAYQLPKIVRENCVVETKR